MLTFCLHPTISQTEFTCAWKGFEMKSQQKRTHHLERPRNGRRLLAGGGAPGAPPPGPVMVKVAPFKAGTVCGS